MFFALLALRPATAPLEPGPRLELWSRVLERFFAWVVAAIALLLASGYAMIFGVYGGFRGIGLHIHLMQGVGIIMMLLFFHLYFAALRQGVRVDRSQMRGHRGLAVGGAPACAEAAIRSRAKAQRAFALLLEHKGVVDDAALAPGPGGRKRPVDAWPDGVDRGEVVAMHRFDPEQNLAAVRIKPVPDIAKLGSLAAVAGRARAGRCRRRCCRFALRAGIGQFGRQFHLSARICPPAR